MNSEIEKIKERLKGGMIDFIVEGDTGYDQSDVESCMQIIDRYLVNMSKSSGKEEGMKEVEKAVLALNTLNEKCGDELIETEQREDICEIIIIAGHDKGYNDLSDDITEEWREW